jgi:hypothetical protein
MVITMDNNKMGLIATSGPYKGGGEGQDAAARHLAREEYGRCDDPEAALGVRASRSAVQCSAVQCSAVQCSAGCHASVSPARLLDTGTHLLHRLLPELELLWQAGDQGLHYEGTLDECYLYEACHRKLLHLR